MSCRIEAFSDRFRQFSAYFGHPVYFGLSSTQKEIIGQTDLYLVVLSSKTYVFEDKLTKC